jgi:hypothetical protein
VIGGIQSLTLSPRMMDIPPNSAWEDSKDNLRRGGQTMRLHLGFLVGPAMALSLYSSSIAAGLASPSAEEKDPKESNREKQSYPMPVEQFLKGMKGWTLISEPDARKSETVISKESDKVRTKYVKPTQIKYSWVLVCAPTGVPTGKPLEITYDLACPEEMDITFTFEDSKTTTLHVAKSPVSILKDGKRDMRLTMGREAKTDIAQTVVLLQQRIEIMENGMVIEVGYLPYHAMVVLEKKTEGKEAPEKPKD